MTIALENQLVSQTIEEILKIGVTEFCICPGARNSFFTVALSKSEQLVKYYWPEERSGAFFALGRSRALGKPVAIITTSGTAVGELLPAVMEAYYTGVKLLVVTADRPSRFRNSGAPQSAEQENIFGIYTPFKQNIEAKEICQLDDWNQKAPAHLNICFEEPTNAILEQITAIEFPKEMNSVEEEFFPNTEELQQFLDTCKYPMVILGSLKSEDRPAVTQFLLELNAPIYAEATSGLREEKRLSHLLLACSDDLLNRSKQANYPIDGVLRIGGVPTLRFWRDLEEKKGVIKVCSINDVPFSGLSWADIICTPINKFLRNYIPEKRNSEEIELWQKADENLYKQVVSFFGKYPEAEPSMVRELSEIFEKKSLVYLGNSLPIREWDFASIREDQEFRIEASRGLNGIDGQISTFLGLTSQQSSNYCLIGDLTALYDLAAPWIISQMPACDITIIIINNGGGKIFDRMFPYKEFQNTHTLNFSGLAALWNLEYHIWHRIPEKMPEYRKPRIIEIIPSEEQTSSFWNDFKKL